MVQRWEDVKTSTRCIFACSQTFYYILIEIVEREYENKNHGGFIEQKREGVEVGKGVNGRFFHFFSFLFFSFYLALRARSRTAYLLEVHYQTYESARCVACQFFCESGSAYTKAPFKTSITEILRFVHKYFKLNNTSAKNFGLDFQTSIKKEKNNFELPSPCTLLVSGVVQLSEHEVR